VFFAAALAIAAGAPSFLVLLLAFAVLYPASGAFVSLSQATLMDLQPERREHNMARWTFAGAVGAVAGPLLLAALVLVGLGWRELFAAFAVLAVALILLAARGHDGASDEARPNVRRALRVLLRRDVFRWLFLLELSDLLLDVFVGFLALFLVDEAGTSIATAGLAVAIWTGAGLVGSGAMIPLLRRLDSVRYLRVSATVTGVLFVAFLVVPDVGARIAFLAAMGLVNAGWYPVLKAQLYRALGDASGLALTVGALFPLNVLLPLGIAALAERWGLDVALWPLLAAPAALLLFVPRRPEPPRDRRLTPRPRPSRASRSSASA
jgi:MFS transporter, FSR family, fosmidomycin resistance protein